MKNKLLAVLFVLLSSAPVVANALPPLSPSELLAAAIVDACRLAHLRLGGDPAAFEPSRVEPSPSGDAAGALDVWLPDSDGLDRFARCRALGLPTPWLEFTSARHARRVLEAHYR